MVATVSSGQTDSMFFGNWVGDSILEEQRGHNVTKPLMDIKGRRPGLVYNWPIDDDPGVGSSNQTEGTAFSETVLTTSSQTATAKLNGQVATITDVLDAVSIVDAVSHFSQMLGRSCAEEFELTATNLFTAATGAWSAATLAGFYDAMADLEAADAKGEFVAVIKNTALATMRTDLTTATTVSFAGNANNPTLGLASNFANGFVGNIAGVDSYTTTINGTSCMFIKGVTFGIYEVWDTKTETHRDTFRPGTQIACTTLYGGATVRAAWATDV